MEIKEEHLPQLTHIELKYKSNKYPQCSDLNLPRMYFVSLFIGSRGSGKTYSCCQLLKLYEKYGLAMGGHYMQQRIILISPTAPANPVFTSLKNLNPSDILWTYSDSLLMNIMDDIASERIKSAEYQKKLCLWNKCLKMKNLYELDQEELIQLENMHYEPPELPRYPNGVVNFLILDDLVGSAAYKSTGKSALTNLVLRNRHMGINILMMTQNLKSVPKSIRSNTSLFVIFKFASKRIIVDDLYEELSNCITLENFEKLLDFATIDEHDSLVIDFSQLKTHRFKKNWSTILRLSR